MKKERKNKDKMSNNDENRKLISSILKDTTLSNVEKNRRIQEINSNSAYCQIIKSSDQSNCSHDCEHYKKGCSRLHFACCDIYDPCNRCHNEKTSCSLLSPKINSVICNQCDFEQEPGRVCVNCTYEFSTYYCDICKVWTEKECYHCFDCGVCKVGKQEDMFHCHTCEACFNLATREKHRCAKSILKGQECPVCLKSILTSQISSYILPCGHVVHGDCWREAAKIGSYNCPICRKSLIDMTKIWNMLREKARMERIPGTFWNIEINDIVESPDGDFQVTSIETVDGHKNYNGILIKNGEIESYQRDSLQKFIYNNILCNDCEKQSKVELNYVGHECQECGSFNTTII